MYRENDAVDGAARREEMGKGCAEKRTCTQMWCDREGCRGQEEIKTDDLLW